MILATRSLSSFFTTGLGTGLGAGLAFTTFLTTGLGAGRTTLLTGAGSWTARAGWARIWTKLASDLRSSL